MTLDYMCARAREDCVRAVLSVLVSKFMCVAEGVAFLIRVIIVAWFIINFSCLRLVLHVGNAMQANRIEL